MSDCNLDFWYDGPKVEREVLEGSEIDVATRSSQYYQVLGFLHIQQWVDHCNRMGREGGSQEIDQECLEWRNTIWGGVIVALHAVNR